METKDKKMDYRWLKIIITTALSVVAFYIIWIDTGENRPESQTREQTQTYIRSLEKEWMDAWKARDSQRFSQLLADDFVMNPESNRGVSKDDWVKQSMGSFVCNKFEWLDMSVLVYGTTAVVNSTIRQEAKDGSADCSGTFALTDVWQFRDNGKWNVVARESKRLMTSGMEPGATK